MPSSLLRVALRVLRTAAGAISLAAWAAAAGAAPVKLDDTGTQLSPPNLRMAWRDAAAG